MAISEAQAQKISESIDEVRLLLRSLVKIQLSTFMEVEFVDEAKAEVYELTGESTAREISDATGVSIAAISRMWTRWDEAGLITKDGNRYRRLI